MSVIKNIAQFALLSIFLLSVGQSLAQELSNYSSGNLKFLAGEAEAKGDYLTAAEFYEELGRRKPQNHKFQYRLARNLHKSSQFSKAKPIYAALTESNQKDYPLAPFYYGRILIMEGNCEQAVKVLDQFRSDYRGEKEDRKYRRMAKFSIEACTESKFSEEGNFFIQPLSSQINGSNMEGAPIFNETEEIYFSTLQAEPNRVYEDAEQLPEPKYLSASRVGGEWKPGSDWETVAIGGGYQAVSASFNPDRNRLYISGCKDIYSAEKQCDLFISEQKNGQWSAPKRLPEPLNSKFQERHPAVGIDEKGRETLYFVSDREDGKGGFDIWYSTYYAKKDEFKEPRNCGSKVNSVGDELTPFVDPESGLLYFSSDAHPGLGGLDIFSSSGSRSKWMEPENLGSKINGPMDELYYALDPSGQSGLFVSNRTYGQKKQPCCDDLFYFTDPDLIRLNYDGYALDMDGKPIDGTTVSIFEIDDSTQEEYIRKRVLTDDEGSFDFRLEPNKMYKVKAEKKGYFSREVDISTKNEMVSKKLKLDLKLEEITDKAFVLENIYYGFNEAALTENAITAIDTGIYDILIENPTIVVEIGSHTDSKGRSEYNARLSQDRAESVVKYLIKRGIRADRLRAKGYGETQPVAPNKNNDGSDNPEGRAKNRRTEFKVIGEVELEEDDE